jgi:hypothetical protein
MRKTLWVTCVVLVAAAMIAGCGAKKNEQAMESSSDSLLASNPSEPASGNITPQTEYQQPAPEAPAAPAPTPKPKAKHTAPPRSEAPKPSAPVNTGVTVPEGTPFKVAVDAQISSETAQPGDTWTGVVKEPVVIGTAAPIPAGSVVHGVITGSLAAEKGNRATLVLSVKSITVGSTEYSVPAGTDSIIAGSPRARNLGRIARRAAGRAALIGKAVGGGKGALIGGLLGGGAATGVVAKSKGYQVVVKPGTELTFTVSRSVVMK